MKARPRNEVVANKAARGDTTNMTSAELSLLEESSQGKAGIGCVHELAGARATFSGVSRTDLLIFDRMTVCMNVWEWHVFLFSYSLLVLVFLFSILISTDKIHCMTHLCFVRFTINLQQ